MISYLLSTLILLPLASAGILLILPGKIKHIHKYIALGVGLLQCALLVMLVSGFDPSIASPGSSDGFQFVEQQSWLMLDLGSYGKLSAQYYLGIDGLNLWMVILSVIVLLFSVIASWKITDRPVGYFALFLLLNASVIGCFIALDFLLFYLFFEFMLLPMFFLIGLWGGPRKDYASIKFFLYTLFGSLLILIVMIMLYSSVADPLATGQLAGIQGTNAEIVESTRQMLASGQIKGEQVVHTFNLVAMANPANYVSGGLLSPDASFVIGGMPLRYVAFLLLFIGFAVKIPLVPLHTWLPDAHVEAPTAISVVLAGVLLKVGGYGLIRTGYLILPDAATYFAWTVALVGVISIIYGAMNALASTDLKRLVAYSSVSHMGFVVLGLASNTAEGVAGGIYQMVSHGIVSAALFILVGVLYDRTHDRRISNYSGLAAKMPAFTVLSIVFFFASMALPGFSGFIAEILVLLGAFASETINAFVPRWMAIVAALGMILSAAYYTWTLQRMYFGKFYVRHFVSDFGDLNKREYLMLLPLTVLTIALGLFPSIVLDDINPAVTAFIDLVNKAFQP